MDTQRNKDATRRRLIDAVEQIVERDGFEALGVRRVAERAGVNKTLIYRYFGSLDGLIFACVERHDFWAGMSGNKLAETDLTFPSELPEQPTKAEVAGYLKQFYRTQIAHYRGDAMLKRLRRWELSTDNDLLTTLRARREENGVRFTESMIALTSVDPTRARAISALVDAGIAYLSMLADECVTYNGVEIDSDEGWQQLEQGIDSLIETLL